MTLPVSDCGVAISPQTQVQRSPIANTCLFLSISHLVLPPYTNPSLSILRLLGVMMDGLTSSMDVKTGHNRFFGLHKSRGPVIGNICNKFTLDLQFLCALESHVVYNWNSSVISAQTSLRGPKKLWSHFFFSSLRRQQPTDVRSAFWFRHPWQ